jgi:periplasmic protein TonB
MNQKQEQKNKQIAGLTTVLVNAALFFLLFFVAAWRAPDPPLPEFGIELNFGVDMQGGGNVQPTEEAGAVPEQQELETTPEQPEEEASETETVQQAVSKTESPVTVKQEPKETPKEVKEVKKEEKKTEPVKTEEKEEPKTVYTPSEKTNPSDNPGKEASQGDDAGKTGDKGDPKGSLDADALYGKQGGGGGGSGLEMAGWKWDAAPKPDLANNESGRLVFEIKVDENGDIISIRTVERSVSLAAEKICRAEIEKLTFSKTGSNVPSVSTGRITFVVRSK